MLSQGTGTLLSVFLKHGHLPAEQQQASPETELQRATRCWQISKTGNRSKVLG